MSEAQKKRAELVERLTWVFRRYGYEGASMTRIAEATGMGKASLYHYFPEGKAQMAQAAIDATAEWFEENIFRPLEGNHPPRQRLDAMLEKLRDYYKGGRCAAVPLVVSVCEDRVLFSESVGAFYERWIETAAKLLVDAGLAHDVAQKRAHDCVERIEGALTVSCATDDPNVFDRMVQEMPDQILASASRAGLWTSRARYIAPPMSAGSMVNMPMPTHW